MRGGHAKIIEIKEREGLSVYQCICRSVMKKTTFEWVAKQKTPSKNNCSRGFFRICRSVAANIEYSLVSERCYSFLQLRIGSTDLSMVVPRNDAIFPKLHTNQYELLQICYWSKEITASKLATHEHMVIFPHPVLLYCTYVRRGLFLQPTVEVPPAHAQQITKDGQI